MADIVVDYMKEHGKAPDSINYEGATIGYYDLVYNFALLTEDDTSASNMNFPSEFGFHRYYSNFLYDILPIGIIIIVIIAVLLVIRKIIKSIKRRIQRRKMKKARKAMYNRNSRTLYSNNNYSQNSPRRLNRQRRRRR